MNLLNIEHISKIYGEKIIFDDASFGVQEGDKIGIVGINGTGKTTLLRMIAGTEVPDDVQIIRQNGMKIAHLTQNPVFPEGATILSYVQSVAEDMEWRVQSNLNTLGITDHTMKIEHLSGGQKRRVAMAKVLAEDFDLLLLDEPTNHLDGEMISWLEGYLRAYRGTVIMVTHDRYFLDQVTNRILEISHGKMYSYDANYTTFLELKAQREEMELASERKRQSILRMELEWAKRGCRARTTKQKARLERLESLKNGSAPVTDDTITLDSVETRMGKKTMELHHVSKSYGEKVLVRDFSYTVLKNQKLGIIGPNGCGKSTLIKMMAGLVQPDSGRSKWERLSRSDILHRKNRRWMTARESLTMSKRSANILSPEMAESAHRSFWSGFCLLRICNMRRSGNCREERKEDCIFWGFWHRTSICF